MSDKNKRNVNIYVGKRWDKAWAALKCITYHLDGDEWLYIDDIGEFLVNRQEEAEESGFDKRHPSTRYALGKRVTATEGWTDMSIIKTLQDLYTKKFVEMKKEEGKYFFKYIDVDNHRVWKLKNISVPFNKAWKEELE